MPFAPQGATQSLGAGIGLRSPHIGEVLARRPEIGFLEVHTENYFGGGAKLKSLERLRSTYPISFHGVGLSLGSAEPLDRFHLDQIKALVDRFDPVLVSEHLSWNAVAGVHVPDLLPLPYRKGALVAITDHIDAFQSRIRRRILVENPSTYLTIEGADMSEPEFLLEVVQRTGCGILLDINNIFVSARNLGFDAEGYLTALGETSAIGQYHLAGHALIDTVEGSVLIDTHGQRVSAQVWALYADALRLFGDRPTLIEWDTEIPPLDTLLEEAAHANAIRSWIPALELGDG